ncbi:VIT domain-containing protein [Candidatus Latescibacterota bacterium]
MLARIALTVLLVAAVAHGDGILLPEPFVEPLAIKYHRVSVEIDDQTAHTDIDQIFLNPQPWDIEGTYIFPLPSGASFSAFSMYVDGEPLHAEILPADEARQIYEEIVRQRIDPALLEYVGQGAYRARIFPIPAEGEKRVELSYDEILLRDAGIVRYAYPLNTEKFSSEPLEDVSVQVHIRSSAPIKTIFSPSHDIAVERNGEFEARVLYADEGVTPTEDFVLYYTVSADPVGLEILTHFDADEEEGYYLLLAAPQVDPVSEAVIPKRMIFVFDRSGSMAGEKIDQAREALRFAVNSMGPGDELNIVDYGTTVETFAETPVTVTGDIRDAALEYVDGIEASGGTNIHGALLAAMDMLAGDGFAEMVVFLTDGMPTIGEVDEEAIVAEVTDANPGARLFVFGVGYEVNTHLLGRLAGENGGSSTYVVPGEDIEVAVSAFYTKVSSPVLTDLAIDIDGGRARDFYPPHLPNLFRGSQILQLGRLEADGDIVVRLSGQILGETRVFERDVASGEAGPEFLPRLWATRKVGFLLDQIRLHGEEDELVDEVVGLSRRYGIITPYTSFLIVEDDLPAPLAEGTGLRDKGGSDAVRAAEDVADYAGANTTSEVRSQEVRYVGDKTFYRRDGFWEDSEYDETRQAQTYQYGSEAYFGLLRGRPDLGRYLALGVNVLFTSDGHQYRIDEDSTTAVEEERPLPAAARLDQNYPNPFNPTTTIRFEMKEPGSVSLAVYNVAGQRIRSLVRERPLAAGPYEVTWDGTDKKGESVAAGVYVYALQTTGARLMGKMVLMK